jgi:hypothetical protein
VSVPLAAWVERSKSKNFQKPAIASQSRVFCFWNQAAGARRNESKNMNKTYTKVPTQFGPETRFEVKPAPPAPFRATQESELDRLKNRLLREQLGKLIDPASNGPVRRAANEAAALAWVTPYPLLVFPGLFEEKIRAARLPVESRNRERERSPELLCV